MRFSEDKELHENKRHQSRRWNCEKLGDQNIVRNRGEAEMDDNDRSQPTGQDDRQVLHQLPEIIASPALKDPEFVQQKMAGYTDEIRDGNRNQRLQEMTQQPDSAEVHDRNSPSNQAKPDQTMNSFSIQHSVISWKSV
jgi:hypothetical protein